MYADRIVLCGASAYEQKYYFNPDFDALPQQVKEELQILCVMYTEEIGGILTLEFDEDGNLEFKTEALDADAMYDEIGSVLRIKQIRKENRIFWRPWRCITAYSSSVKRSKTGRKDETSDRKCNIAEPCGSGSDGRCNRPAISSAVQRTGRGTFMYGDGQCQGNLL